MVTREVSTTPALSPSVLESILIFTLFFFKEAFSNEKIETKMLKEPTGE